LSAGLIQESESPRRLQLLFLLLDQLCSQVFFLSSVIAQTVWSNATWKRSQFIATACSRIPHDGRCKMAPGWEDQDIEESVYAMSDFLPDRPDPLDTLVPALRRSGASESRIKSFVVHWRTVLTQNTKRP